MGALKIDTFGGMIPATDDRLLPDHAASHSENVWLYSGRLSGLQSPSLVKALTPGTARVFRIPNNYTDFDHLDDSVWMEFENADTDVLRPVVVDDSFVRYYWASSNTPPKYNTFARIQNGDPEFFLGIPAPAAPTLAVVGGSASNVTRAYVATWVSAYGEEGPPSPPVTVTGHPDGSWNLTLSAAASGDLGTNRNLTHTNIYRTITGSDGTTTFFFVAQIAIATLSYSDTNSDTTVSSNSELESTNWTAPPSDLAGWVLMPNGIIAGFRSNELWFCEPYRPHAWPAAYAVTVDFPVVGLGVDGQTLVVMTQSYPQFAYGITPSSMAISKSTSVEPCMSRGSIVSTDQGVLYASPNGLISVYQGVVTNITRKLLTKDKWESITSVPTLRAARLGMAYFAFGSERPGVFDTGSFDTGSFAQQDFYGAYSGVLIDPIDQRVAFSVLSQRDPVTNTQNDPWSGEIFMIKDDNLYRINVAATPASPQVYLWRSKQFQMTKKDNFAALKVYWNEPTNAPAAQSSPIPYNQPGAEYPDILDGSPLGVVRLYADDVLVWTRNLVTSGELMRLPSGFKCDFMQLEIESWLNVYSIQIGSSARELAGV